MARMARGQHPPHVRFMRNTLLFCVFECESGIDLSSQLTTGAWSLLSSVLIGSLWPAADVLTGVYTFGMCAQI